MASSTRTLLLLLLLSVSFCISKCFTFEGHMNGFAQTKRNLADSSCGPLNCVNGVCTLTTIFPFYQCTCNKGWQSPFNQSWIPCVLPNCSVDLGCGSANNTSSSAPPPAVAFNNASFSLCALPICGNGECVASSSGSLPYECKCNAGSTNLMNTTNGYCIPSCGLGGGCSSLNLTLGSSSSSPPPPPSASSNSSQGTSSSPSSSNQTMPNGGTSRKIYVNNFIIICGLLLMQMRLRF